MTTENRHRVFVYGTLLKDEPNHYRLEEGRATLVGEAVTLREYALFTNGAFPYLAKTPPAEADNADEVGGEVWLVSDATLASLDMLEGHPRHYQRTVINLKGGEVAWAYLRDFAVLTAGGVPRVVREAGEPASWRAERARMREADAAWQREEDERAAKRQAARAAIPRLLTLRDLRVALAKLGAEYDDLPILSPTQYGGMDEGIVLLPPEAAVKAEIIDPNLDPDYQPHTYVGGFDAED
jgi:gamma-glutamylaminecyclotransferase